MKATCLSCATSAVHGIHAAWQRPTVDEFESCNSCVRAPIDSFTTPRENRAVVSYLRCSDIDIDIDPTAAGA